MIPQPPLIFSGNAYRGFARRLAKELGLELGNMEIARFSDSEIHVITNDEVKGRDVFIVQPTSAPANEHVMELLLMASAIKQGKPKRITAVMPFFGYRRQEKIMQPGEALSFELIAQVLKTAGISRVLVIDLHKHRSTRYFKETGIAYKELRAFDLICNYFRKKKLENFVVVAPDKGSIPESERYAGALGVPLVRVYKHRTRSKRDQVTIDRIVGNVVGKNVLIIDDEINTAGTLMGVVELLKKHKARNVYVACTHPVFSGPAVERLSRSRIRQVVVTDTVPLPQEKRFKKLTILSVVPLFASTIRTWTKM